jgi:hypothetical protein
MLLPGGGWGALVTGTLISKRKNPRYVIGSVCLAEFFVVFASAVTFFILLKHIPVGRCIGTDHWRCDCRADCCADWLENFL